MSDREDGVAAGRYLTLGEAVDWAKAHAVSIFHVDPDACDDGGHDPIECSCELTAADAPVTNAAAPVVAEATQAAVDSAFCPSSKDTVGLDAHSDEWHEGVGDCRWCDAVHIPHADAAPDAVPAADGPAA